MSKQTRYVSPLRYPGGKSKAIRQIGPLLPKQVREYREPMVGGGSVFLAARNAGIAQTYWINDFFRDLCVFWQAVQDPPTCERLRKDLEELRRSFADPCETKAYFLDARQEKDETSFVRDETSFVRDETSFRPQDPYRQAFLLFFFNRVSFSGTTRAGGFSSQAAVKRFTASSIERLAPMPEALAGVKITNLDFQDVIEAPGEDVFLFLDPPYYSRERLYGHKGALHEFDHVRLAEVLRKTEHRFLMTYDDCRSIRRLYGWANLYPWRLQYGMSNCNKAKLSRVGAELFICNYEAALPVAQRGAAE